MVVAKNDLLTETEQQQVQQVVNQVVPSSVKTLYISQSQPESQLDLDMVMGINGAAEERIEQVHTHHDHHHDHGHDHEHAHDHFDSFVLNLGQFQPEDLQQALQQLLEQYNVFRVKGFVAVPNKPMRQVIQVVGKRQDSHFDRLWQEGESRKTSLVFIGKQLDQAAIQAFLQQAQAS